MESQYKYLNLRNLLQPSACQIFISISHLWHLKTFSTKMFKRILEDLYYFISNMFIAIFRLGGWMNLPTGSPTNCPRGLEYLTSIDQLLVHQKVELLEGILYFLTKTMSIYVNSLPFSFGHFNILVQLLNQEPRTLL